MFSFLISKRLQHSRVGDGGIRLCCRINPLMRSRKCELRVCVFGTHYK
ncbi:MAG: hypothetical protein LBH59_01790 [Planctomycetaceae bacterium]|nr:hypothetical protein [Planctomycetaceae bacterium]